MGGFCFVLGCLKTHTHTLTLITASFRYTYLVGEAKKQGIELHLIKNNLNLTPLCMAAYYGKESMFEFLLEQRRITQVSKS
jgi:hypothetical protein